MTIKHRFRTAYGDRIKVATSFEGDDGKTIQEQSESTDINNILERYARTGLIEHVAKHEPVYGEFAAFDYQTNQNMIAKINQTFEELPARVRKQFDNNPQIFVEFISTQDNINDMKDGEINNVISPEIPAETAELTSP